MKIIDYWVVSYFSLLKKYEMKGLIATISVLQYFWGMNLFSLLCLSMPLIKHTKYIGFTGLSAIAIILAIAISSKIRNTLEKKYEEQYNIIFEQCSQISKALSILILIIHFFVTLFFVIFGYLVLYRFTR